MPSPEAATQKIIVTPTSEAVQIIASSDNVLSVNPSGGAQVSVINAGPVGPSGMTPVFLTQAAYNALTPPTEGVFYLIVEP